MATYKKIASQTRSLDHRVQPNRHQGEKIIPIGDGEVEPGIEFAGIEDIEETIPRGAIEEIVAEKEFLPRSLMVMVGSNDKGMGLAGTGMNHDGEVRLMKASVGDPEHRLMVETGGPGQTAFDLTGRRFNIGHGDIKIRLEFNAMKEKTKRRIHKIKIERKTKLLIQK
jgi:hypothetical protein